MMVLIFKKFVNIVLFDILKKEKKAVRPTLASWVISV